MADGRTGAWIRKHEVGFYAVATAIWLFVAAVQVLQIAEGGTGPNGLYTLLLVVSASLACLNAGMAVVAYFKRKRSRRD